MIGAMKTNVMTGKRNMPCAARLFAVDDEVIDKETTQIAKSNAKEGKKEAMFEGMQALQKLYI